MRPFLKLIRWPNLVIVILTQYLLYYQVLYPTFVDQQLTPTLDFFHLALLIFSTVCIAAAAYIINDIVDYDIDQINKSGKVIIHRFIPLAKANNYYAILNGLGLVIGIYLSIQTNNFLLLLIYFPVIFMMWWYSKSLKKKPLSGNLIVALNCALVAIIVLLAERPALLELNAISSEEVRDINFVFIAYAVFAFLSTLFREIVKDMEDIQGDKKGGANTLPIAIGLNKSKQVNYFTATLLIVSIGYWLISFATQQPIWSNLFAVIGILLPILYALFELQRADTKDHFHCISQIAKYIMLSGLIYLLVYRF